MAMVGSSPRWALRQGSGMLSAPLLGEVSKAGGSLG